MLYYYYYIINDYGTLTSERIASGGQELKLWAPKLMDRSLVSTELKETMSKRVVNWTEVIEEAWHTTDLNKSAMRHLIETTPLIN